MAKDAAAVTTTTSNAKLFDHGSRYVTVLIPKNSKHADFTRLQLLEKYGETLPPVTNALKVVELSHDAIVYVAHPYRSKRKAKNRLGQDVLKPALDLHLSRPIDIGAECITSPRRGAKIVDYSKISQAISSVAKNDPSGWFFCSYLSGFDKNDFSHATIQLMNR